MVKNMERDLHVEHIKYGFEEYADMRATDPTFTIRDERSEGKTIGYTLCKISYQGSTVPVMISDVLGRQQVYAALAACAIGLRFGMNLVEIGEEIKTYICILK